ncbi:HrpF/NolX family T3SS translocon protein [Paraburkholderia humisilvae]|uniref:Type III secretion translocon protein HrpF n=1 Tax=Paraburkholderia humisilvae TaxID=627669 RepID=A0A6J5F3C8_9BURK|nr:HrpF/NolX family T3SS translocon protein [Paraburkholderia humisilvae]CAB3772201.1 hypothetical protein LMG29542_06823 [Paraburkholderia humisilvae]
MIMNATIAPPVADAKASGALPSEGTVDDPSSAGHLADEIVDGLPSPAAKNMLSAGMPVSGAALPLAPGAAPALAYASLSTPAAGVALPAQPATPGAAAMLPIAATLATSAMLPAAAALATVPTGATLATPAMVPTAATLATSATLAAAATLTSAATPAMPALVPSSVDAGNTPVTASVRVLAAALPAQPATGGLSVPLAADAASLPAAGAPATSTLSPVDAGSLHVFAAANPAPPTYDEANPPPAYDEASVPPAYSEANPTLAAASATHFTIGTVLTPTSSATTPATTPGAPASPSASTPAGATSTPLPAGAPDPSGSTSVNIPGVDANAPPDSLNGILYKALTALKSDPSATAPGSGQPADGVNPPVSTTSGDGTSGSDGSDGASANTAPPSFGQAAQTLYNWMSTDPSMQGGKCVGPDELQQIANGTGVGAGASPELQAAAREMLANGDQFKSALGGKDDLANANDFAKFVATDKDTPLSDQQLQTLSVLGRHEGDISLKTKDIQSKIDDPNTPPDLKAALQQLQSDPSLVAKLDAGQNGKIDGKFSGKDITNLVKSHPELKQYNEAQAELYVNDYIPSDDTDDDPQPRPMTQNDAMRELYRYSDYLPKNISKQDLQNIVDGTGGEGKCPPQVIAAAEYFLKNPSQWQDVAGPSGSIKRSSLENVIAQKVQLNQDEKDTIDTIQSNRDAFFGGGNLTRDKLKSIAADTSQSDDVRKAAQQMLDDPMLFGMLDNALHGHAGNPIYAADDGKISSKDFDKFNANLQNKNVATVPASHAPATPEEAAEVQTMRDGTLDQPEEKKSKGGGLLKFAEGLLKVFSKILDVIGTVFSALGEIPGIGIIFKAASAGAAAISGQLNVASVAAGGGSKADIINAEKEAGLSTAAGVVSAFVAPGAGGAIVKGIEGGVEHAVDSGISKSVITKAVGSGVKDEAEDEAGGKIKDEIANQYNEQPQPSPAV